MAERVSSTPVFSLKGKLMSAALDMRGRFPSSEQPPQKYDPYAPYSASWKEFDKLQKSAKSGGWLNWTHWYWGGGISGLISLFDPHQHSRRIEQAFFVAVVMLTAIEAVRARHAASQLAHWPCPRCYAEWPGKKTKKDPQCAVCGLKLHQMAP